MKNRNLNLPITIVSIAIPLVVAVLFFLPRPHVQVGFNITILPLINAVLNSMTTILLLASLYFIRHGQQQEN